jgi:vesicle transport protein SEC22
MLSQYAYSMLIRCIDTFISKTTRLYEDTRTAQTAALAHGAGETPGGSSNLDKMNAELQDVTRIMTKNMEDLLWRGDSLDRELNGMQR